MTLKTKKTILGLPKLPSRAMFVLVPFFLSFAMSGIVSFVSISRNIGINVDMFSQWLNAWPPSWMIAFPSVLVILPIARKLASSLVAIN